jgi:hypothetical protein
MKPFRHQILNGLWAIGAFGLFAVTASAAGLVAKKSGVKVTAQPKPGAEVVGTLGKGDAVQSVARKGMFWQVELADGNEGYVAVFHVKRQTGSSGGLSDAVRQAAQETREEGDDVSSTRMRSAVMGVRGLDESSNTALAGNVTPNLPLVYKMEDRKVASERVESLQQRIQHEIRKRIELGQRR